MTDRVCFEAAVKPLIRASAAFTGLRLWPGSAGVRKVGVESPEHAETLALSRTPEFDRVFLWAWQSVPDRKGALPVMRLAALRGTGKTDNWTHLTPGKKRKVLHRIGTAKPDTTRARRFARMIRGLTE